MSNNPYEPSSSVPEPEENQPAEAPPETTESQSLEQEAAPTVPLETNVAPQPYGAYGQQAPAAQQNEVTAQSNPYAAPHANGAYGREASAPQYGTEQSSPYVAAGQQPADAAYSASDTPLNGAAYGTPQQPNYNTYGAVAPQGKKAKNTVGMVALALSALGFVMGLFYPWVALVGWFFLFAGFVTGIVGFFQKNKEKITPSIAVALSVVGSIASIIALIVTVAASSGSTNISSTSSGSSASSGSTSTDASTMGGVLKFGETAEYSDGLKFTVSEARTDYTPSKTSAQGNETLNKYVAFTVTIENGTAQPYEPYGYITGNSGGKEIDQVFDSAKGIGNIRSTKILPGEKVSYDVAFAVADPNNVTLDITVDFDRDEILYTNK